MSPYDQWIQNYKTRHNDYVRGKCHEATEEMVKQFPELRRAAGFVFCSWGREQHWWCVTPEGVVVDPTRTQFQSVFNYQELDLNDPKTRSLVPTGPCMQCGGDCYEGKSSCSPECSRELEAYYNCKFTE